MSIVETLAAFNYIPEVSFLLLCPALVTIKQSVSIRGKIPVFAWDD